jgi:hypothetical protein
MGSLLLRRLIVTALLFLSRLDSPDQGKTFCGGIVMAFASSETHNSGQQPHQQSSTAGGDDKGGDGTMNNDKKSKQEVSSSFSSSLPLLPPVDPNREEGTIPSIKLGETIRFEEFGPIILNTDGTTRRIQNWDTLTEQEKAVSWRRISKRNEERRQVLLKQMEEQKAAGKKQADGEL